MAAVRETQKCVSKSPNLLNGLWNFWANSIIFRIQMKVFKLMEIYIEKSYHGVLRNPDIRKNWGPPVADTEQEKCCNAHCIMFKADIQHMEKSQPSPVQIYIALRYSLCVHGKQDLLPALRFLAHIYMNSMGFAIFLVDKRSGYYLLFKWYASRVNYICKEQESYDKYQMWWEF